MLTGLILSMIVNPLSGTSVLPGIHNIFPQSIHSLFSLEDKLILSSLPSVSADYFASFFPKMFENQKKPPQISTSTPPTSSCTQVLLPLSLCIHRDAVTTPSPSHITFFILCSQTYWHTHYSLDFCAGFRCLEHSASRYPHGLLTTLIFAQPSPSQETHTVYPP